MPNENIQAYFSHVTVAVTDLQGLTLPPDITALKATHGKVRHAHKHLKKACRTYNRRLWLRRVIIWGEWRAVSMGYMSFTDVDEMP